MILLTTGQTMDHPMVLDTQPLGLVMTLLTYEL